MYQSTPFLPPYISPCINPPPFYLHPYILYQSTPSYLHPYLPVSIHSFPTSIPISLYQSTPVLPPSLSPCTNPPLPTSISISLLQSTPFLPLSLSPCTNPASHICISHISHISIDQSLSPLPTPRLQCMQYSN